MPTTPEKSVDTICQCRKGSMDDKQFRATVEYNIDSLLQTERQKRDEVGRLSVLFSNLSEQYYSALANKVGTYEIRQELKGRVDTVWEELQSFTHPNNQK